MTSASSGKIVSLCPALFCTPGPTCLLLQVSLDFLHLYSNPLRWKGHFFSVSSRRSCRSSQSCSTSASLASVVRAQTWITVTLNGLPWKWVKIILSFLRLHSSTAFQTLLLIMRAIPFLLRDSCPHSRQNGHLD